VNFTQQIVIGNNTILSLGCHISSIEKIIIGNNILTGRRISIIDNSHGSSSLLDFILPPSKRELTSKGPIIIGKNVLIGDKLTILSGVSKGDNSIIGANSVVTKNVSSNSIALGMPVKTIITIQ
jgi:acetyltransferase-like isoleucine patch superfamily enzyme